MRYVKFGRGTKVHTLKNAEDPSEGVWCEDKRALIEGAMIEVAELPKSGAKPEPCRICGGNLYNAQRKKLGIRRGYKARGLE